MGDIFSFFKSSFLSLDEANLVLFRFSRKNMMAAMLVYNNY